ncbi:MAG: biotin transporter BioY [Cyanobacteria bacterium J06598_1]
MFAPAELLWAFIGLILTIGSTWIEASALKVPIGGWLQGSGGTVEPYALGVTFQFAVALFTGCMGGKNAAALSQIAYIVLGIVLFERFALEVFAQGAGVGYLAEPSFGYLLGFVPAGWVCGNLAIRKKKKVTLERLAFAAIAGLATMHLCGFTYLVLGHLFRWLPTTPSLSMSIMDYSISQFPGQIMVSCAIALIAFGLRKALFY